MDYFDDPAIREHLIRDITDDDDLLNFDDIVEEHLPWDILNEFWLWSTKLSGSSTRTKEHLNK